MVFFITCYIDRAAFSAELMIQHDGFIPIPSYSHDIPIITINLVICHIPDHQNSHIFHAIPIIFPSHLLTPKRLLDAMAPLKITVQLAMTGEKLIDLELETTDTLQLGASGVPVKSA